MCDIKVMASELWDFCIEFAKDEEMRDEVHEIAENYELGIKVYVAIDKFDAKYFSMVVMKDEDEEVFYEPFADEVEAFETAAFVYENFVDTSVPSILGNSHWDSYLNEEDLAYERECELDDAVWGFLEIAYTQNVFDDDEIQEIKNHFLAYLAKEYDENIYRPGFLTDDEGNEFFEEFPYKIGDVLGYPDEDFEFDDDDEDFEYVDMFEDELDEEEGDDA